MSQRDFGYLVRRTGADGSATIYHTDSRDDAYNKAGEYAGFTDYCEEYRLACLRG